METTMLFVFLGFTIIYSIAESLHDANVILNDKFWNSYSERWHFYGLLQNAFTFIFPAIIAGFIIRPYLAGILLLMNGMLFWQLHDTLIGYRLYRQLFYLGNNGLNKWLKKVFWNGRNLLIIRGGISACCVLEYVRNL